MSLSCPCLHAPDRSARRWTDEVMSLDVRLHAMDACPLGAQIDPNGLSFRYKASRNMPCGRSNERKASHIRKTLLHQLPPSASCCLLGASLRWRRRRAWRGRRSRPRPSSPLAYCASSTPSRRTLQTSCCALRYIRGGQLLECVAELLAAGRERLC